MHHYQKAQQLSLVVLVLPLLLSSVFGQSDLYWRSATDGEFSELKWSADATVPGSLDRVYLNATTQPYTVNVQGSYLVAAMEVGRIELPFSNVTLSLYTNSVLNLTSEFTIFPGATVESSGTDITLQVPNFTINGGQTVSNFGSSISWRTSSILITNGGIVEVHESGYIFFFATTSFILSSTSSITMAPETLFAQIGAGGPAFIDGSITMNNGIAGFAEEVTFGPTSVVALRNSSQLNFASSPVVRDGRVTVIISSSSFLLERSKLQFRTFLSIDTEIFIRGAAQFVARGFRTFVGADTIQIEGPNTRMTMTEDTSIAFFRLIAVGGAHVELNTTQITTNSPLTAPTNMFSRLHSVDGSTIIIRDSYVLTPPRDTIVQNGSTLKLVFSTYNNPYTQSRQNTVVDHSNFIIEGPSFIFGPTFAIQRDPFLVSNNSSVQLLGPRTVFQQAANETIVQKNSSFIVRNRSSFVVNSGVKISEGSILNATESSVTLLSGGTVEVLQGSRMEFTSSDFAIQVLVDDSANLTLVGAVKVLQGSTIDFAASNFTIQGGVIMTDGSSKLNLHSGSRLIGVGSIQGTVNNDGGVISYANETLQTDLYVRNLTQSNSSVISTVISINSSITLVRGGSVELGGTIIVSLGASANISSTGIVLVIADDKLSGETPTLQLQLPNGTTVTISPAEQSNPCRDGYRLQRREKSLFLVFETASLASCTSSPSSSVVSSPLSFIEFSSNSGVIIGAVVGSIVALAIVVAAVIVLVPSVRNKVQPFLQRSKHPRIATDELDERGAPTTTSESTAESTKQGWVRTKAREQK